MVRSDMFKPVRGPEADTVNQAGGIAYNMEAKLALACYAMTGTFSNNYYTSAQDDLKRVIRYLDEIKDLPFVAKLAVYARERGYMKDMPAFLLAYIACKNTELAGRIFSRVSDTGRMLRNFVQFIRSGVFGRKSFGTAIKRMIQSWLVDRPFDRLFADSVGNNPSIADVIKMVHPKPKNDKQAALFAYLIGKDCDKSKLTAKIQQFEAFKTNPEKAEVPAVDFRQLSSFNLEGQRFANIVFGMSWHQLRLNLNQIVSRKAFDVKGVKEHVARTLADRETVRKTMVFPYQLFSTYLNIKRQVPNLVADALQDAMEVACENVPTLEGGAVILVDVSGSMGQSVTGHVPGKKASSVRCVDAAAVFASAFGRANPGNVEIVPFDTRVHDVRISPRDTVTTNAKKIARNGGGTNIGMAMEYVEKNKMTYKNIIIVSDNESWLGGPRDFYGRQTRCMEIFNQYKRRVKGAKLVCIDIVPYGNTQAPDNGKDILNVGGFSDNVFTVVGNFCNGYGPGTWVQEIERTEI